MPKQIEKTTVVSTARVPYPETAPCTLTCKPRTCYKRGEDGQLDAEQPFVSYKWMDCTLNCTKGDGKREDIWLASDKAKLDSALLCKENKQMRYFLFDMGRKCQCKGFHKLTRIEA